MIRTIVAILLIFACSVGAAFASPLQLTAESALSFGDHLFDQGDYYRAISEYERVLYFFPAEPAAKAAQYKIALSYLKGEKWGVAVEKFRTLAGRHPDEETGRKALFMVGETYFAKKDHASALAAYQEFVSRYPQESQSDEARMKMGWCYLSQGQWEQGAGAFRGIPRESARHEDGQRLAAAAGEFPLLPRKSPSLAAGLSAVLPGAGQLYVERPRDAAITVLLNGLFLWGGLEAIHRGNNLAGGILLGFESGWYVGNIYNAASSAHKYNRSRERDFIDKLQGEFGMSLSRNESGNPLLALTFRY
uniref:Tetratricopeptide TPR_2 repeat protein n=1 Tax=Geobacter sp. (strain M21) TaxID=443144 RepID=C6E6V4_GEOSM